MTLYMFSEEPETAEAEAEAEAEAGVGTTGQEVSVISPSPSPTAVIIHDERISGTNPVPMDGLTPVEAFLARARSGAIEIFHTPTESLGSVIKQAQQTHDYLKSLNIQLGIGILELSYLLSQARTRRLYDVMGCNSMSEWLEQTGISPDFVRMADTLGRDLPFFIDGRIPLDFLVLRPSLAHVEAIHDVAHEVTVQARTQVEHNVKNPKKMGAVERAEHVRQYIEEHRDQIIERISDIVDTPEGDLIAARRVNRGEAEKGLLYLNFTPVNGRLHAVIDLYPADLANFANGADLKFSLPDGSGEFYPIRQLPDRFESLQSRLSSSSSSSSPAPASASANMRQSGGQPYTRGRAVGGVPEPSDEDFDEDEEDLEELEDFDEDEDIEEDDEDGPDF